MDTQEKKCMFLTTTLVALWVLIAPCSIESELVEAPAALNKALIFIISNTSGRFDILSKSNVVLNGDRLLAGRS
jgi:hypothetical protein